jgi:hypothetical protein
MLKTEIFRASYATIPVNMALGAKKPYKPAPAAFVYWNSVQSHPGEKTPVLLRA